MTYRASWRMRWQDNIKKNVLLSHTGGDIRFKKYLMDVLNIRWAGHVLRMDVEEMTKKMFSTWWQTNERTEYQGVCPRKNIHRQIKIQAISKMGTTVISATIYAFGSLSVAVNTCLNLLHIHCKYNLCIASFCNWISRTMELCLFHFSWNHLFVCLFVCCAKFDARSVHVTVYNTNSFCINFSK